MILTCPSCRTRYQADSAHFHLPGRNVKCAKCGEIWFQAAPEPEGQTEPEPVMAPPIAPVDAAAAEAELSARDAVSALDFDVQPAIETEAPRRAVRAERSWAGALAQAIGWVAFFFLVGAIGWSIVQYRQTIAGLWPQSASFYAFIGMPVNVRGIALTNIAYRQEYEDGQPVLSVTGKVVNVSNKEQVVPEIRVVLLDDAKHELYQWTFDAGIPTLKPGSESAFVTRLSSPPAEARNLDVRFAEAGAKR
jgi:predicted Zn finger-like uncharacterized protein